MNDFSPSQPAKEKAVAAYDFADFVSPTPHPGEHLREEFLPGYHLTAGALAKAMGLKDRTRVERLVREQQPVVQRADNHRRTRPASERRWPPRQRRRLG